jgi:hypothetical protein
MEPLILQGFTVRTIVDDDCTGALGWVQLHKPGISNRRQLMEYVTFLLKWCELNRNDNRRGTVGIRP